jgi:hypothetical protein
VLVLCWKELIQSLYYDASPDLPGSGAKVYAERTPYFLEVKRLRDLNEEQAKAMRRMKKQRDEELKALKGRNEMINKTLGAWNRALGQASANSEAEALRQRMESLEKLLADASAEVARVREESYKDPLLKLLEAYEACDSAQREEALASHIFESEQSASVMVGNQVAEVAGWVAHFLSRLPPEARAGMGEATRGRVLVMLARILDVTDEEKLQLGAQLLTDQRNNQLVGVTLAGVLVGKSPAHKDLCTGIAQFLKADLSRDSPDYQPPKDDLQAMVCYQVLKELRRSIGSGEAPGKAVAGRADGSGGSGANSAAGKGGKDGKSGGKKGKKGKGGKGGGEDEDDEGRSDRERLVTDGVADAELDLEFKASRAAAVVDL